MTKRLVSTGCGESECVDQFSRCLWGIVSIDVPTKRDRDPVASRNVPLAVVRISDTIGLSTTKVRATSYGFTTLSTFTFRRLVGGHFVDVAARPVIIKSACAIEAKTVTATKAPRRAPNALFIVCFPLIVLPP